MQAPFLWQPTPTSSQRWWRFKGPKGQVLIFGRPSRESSITGQRSQDAVGLMVDASGWTIVVCDGVSQSFFGDFAAWLLASTLTPALHRLQPKNFPNKDQWWKWGQKLALYYRPFYESLPIPDNLPDLVRGVFEQKRKLGSETMFAALRIWFSSTDKSHPLALLHGGNIRVRIAGLTKGEINAPMDDSYRWSTIKGFLHPPHIWQHTFTERELSKVIIQIYSDGLETLDALTLPTNLDTIQKYADTQWQGPTTDDQTFVEVWFRSHARGDHIPEPQPSKYLSSFPSSITRPQYQPPRLSWETQRPFQYFYVETASVTGKHVRITTPINEIFLPPNIVQVRLQGVDASGNLSHPTPWFKLPSSISQQSSNRHTHKIRKTRRGIDWQIWHDRFIILAVLLLLLIYFVLLVAKNAVSQPFSLSKLLHFVSEHLQRLAPP